MAGVVGAALIGGIIAAATSDNGKKKRERERQDLCEGDGYNSNYDPRNNSYRASDGRWYSCN